MGSGVFTFQGGSDLLIKKMTAELRKNGVELRKHVLVQRILVEEREGRKVACGVVAGDGRVIRAKAVLSNANIKNTIFRLAGAENFSPDFVKQAEAVRINTSSCQVYFGIREGESIPHIGDLVFTSEAPRYSPEELTALHTTSRTFSVYYPDTRPGGDRYTVVASLNGRYPHWKELSDVDLICLLSSSFATLSASSSRDKSSSCFCFSALAAMASFSFSSAKLFAVMSASSSLRNESACSSAWVGSCGRVGIDIDVLIAAVVMDDVDVTASNEKEVDDACVASNLEIGEESFKFAT
jgi:hypothetical protein